jgi:hypothetical protein
MSEREMLYGLEGASVLLIGFAWICLMIKELVVWILESRKR